MNLGNKNIKTKYGFITTKQRSNIMKKIRDRDTNPEIIFRKKIWSLGYRYRKNYSKLPGKPDLVFTKKKVVVFIDGEFWHGFNWEEKKIKIKSNKKYWIEKIEKNIERDKKYERQLRKNGWEVIRFWSHEINRNFENCIEKVISKLNDT